MSEDNYLEYSFERLSCDDIHDLQYLEWKHLELQKREQQLDQKHLEQQKRDQQLNQKHLDLQKREQQLNQKQLEMQHLELQHQHHQQQQQEPTPFHIVLIDLKAASNGHFIRCVEKPLMGDEDLKYVALSYRWGGLNEAMIDTGLDYIATVTSFHISHFTNYNQSWQFLASCLS